MLGAIVLFIGAVLAALLLEYAIRRPQLLRVPWECVESVTLETGKWRACLVYPPPEKPE